MRKLSTVALVGYVCITLNLECGSKLSRDSSDAKLIGDSSDALRAILAAIRLRGAAATGYPPLIHGHTRPAWTISIDYLWQIFLA